jgi:hypothetical protein
MTEQNPAFFVGVYWGPRPEAVDRCAARLARVLKQAGEKNPLLDRWYRPGKSRTQALSRPTPVDEAAIRMLLEAGAKDNVSSDLGFPLQLWNGRDKGQSATFSAYCGGNTDFALNNMLFRLPSEAPNPLSLAAEAESLLVRWVEEVDPDWGLVKDQRNPPPIPDSAKTSSGWVLYFAARKGPIPPLPPSVRLSTTPTASGTIIRLTEDLFDLKRADHLEVAAKVDQALRKRGLLV